MLKSNECPNESLELRNLIETYIFPLFCGTSIYGYEKSSAKKLLSRGNGYKYLKIKLRKTDQYQICITRAQKFIGEEIKLVYQIMAEFSKVTDLKLEKDYKSLLYFNALEKAISLNLSEGSNKLFQFINILSKWSERTYEGGRVSFGFIIDFDQEITQSNINNLNLEFERILNEDFSAVLTDGIHSWIEFDRNGIIISHEEKNAPLNQDILCPQRFSCLAESTSEKRVGIVLLSNGEILLIKNQELKFAKRRGLWRRFHHETTIAQMKAKDGYKNDLINRAIYLTALDVSFARSGGSICFTRKTSENIIFKDEVIDPKDILKEEKSVKSITISKLVNNRKFYDLPRKLRQELMSIDGAMIVDHKGNLIAAGAIISIPSGSVGGGRLAATKALSKYGSAIKISEDGMIQGFSQTLSADKPTEIFSIA